MATLAEIVPSRGTLLTPQLPASPQPWFEANSPGLRKASNGGQQEANSLAELKANSLGLQESNGRGHHEANSRGQQEADSLGVHEAKSLAQEIVGRPPSEEEAGSCVVVFSRGQQPDAEQSCLLAR
jgi:hypothetical protein